MPKLEYFVVAESCSVDRDTNSISIFNIYSELKYPAFPVTLPRAVLISCWVSSESDLLATPHMQAEVYLRIPGEDDLGPFRANFVCDIEFQHVMLEFVNLVFPRPCLAEIELLVNGEHAAKHNIRLAQG